MWSILENIPLRSRKKSKDILKQMNGDTTIQSLWDAGKTILRGKFIALQTYLKKLNKTQMNNLILHLKEFVKEQSPKWVEKRK